MVFRWDAENKKLMSHFSVFIWFAVLCYGTSFLDILKIPAFLGILALFISGFAHEYFYAKTNGKFERKKNESINA